MTHKMNLAPQPFTLISNGLKTVEMRLYDEKRTLINVGDTIVFENTNTHQTVKCIVVKLARFCDFFELYSHYDKVSIGYDKNEVANPQDMLKYYSPEQISKYGALAIEIRLVSASETNH